MKLFITVLISSIALACSNGGSNSSTNTYETPTGYEMATEEVALKSADIAPNASSDQAIEQKIIKESYLRFETQDLDKTYNRIVNFIKQNNGYLQNDYASKNYNRISRNLIIRIPTQNFQEVIDSISNHVDFFDEKRISSRDVTEEFIDLEARLKAKQTLEQRYLDLLSKAKNVKEILEIERELSNIREEIEAKQGRLKYLQNRVSLSTLNIEFYKQTSETGVTVSYGTKVWNAIKSGFNNLSSFFLGLLHIWPFILLIIIVAFWFRRWYKKSQHKK